MVVVQAGHTTLIPRQSICDDYQRPQMSQKRSARSAEVRYGQFSRA